MYFDEVLIDELVDDIVSRNDFYIVSDDESGDLAGAVSKMLSNHGISYNLIDFEGEHDFEDGDCLLAISRSGEGQFLKVVEEAISKKVKVYGLTNKKNSTLAFLCSELIAVDENLEMDVFAIMNQKLAMNLKDDYYEVEKARIKGPPSPAKRLFVRLILWAATILIIVLVILALTGHIP